MIVFEGTDIPTREGIQGIRIACPVCGSTGQESDASYRRLSGEAQIACREQRWVGNRRFVSFNLNGKPQFRDYVG